MTMIRGLFKAKINVERAEKLVKLAGDAGSIAYFFHHEGQKGQRSKSPPSAVPLPKKPGRSF